MKQLTCKAIQHQDVRGKVKYYLEITEGETLFHINIGAGTFKTVHEMQTQLELQLNDEKKSKQESELSAEKSNKSQNLTRA